MIIKPPPMTGKDFDADNITVDTSTDYTIGIVLIVGAALLVTTGIILVIFK